MEQELDSGRRASICKDSLSRELKFLFEPNKQVRGARGNSQAGNRSVAGGPDLEIVCKPGNRVFAVFHFDTVMVMASPAGLMFVILMPEEELSFHLLEGVLFL